MLPGKRGCRERVVLTSPVSSRYELYSCAVCLAPIQSPKKYKNTILDRSVCFQAPSRRHPSSRTGGWMERLWAGQVMMGDVIFGAAHCSFHTHGTTSDTLLNHSAYPRLPREIESQECFFLPWVVDSQMSSRPSPQGCCRGLNYLDCRCGEYLVTFPLEWGI